MRGEKKKVITPTDRIFFSFWSESGRVFYFLTFLKKFRVDAVWEKCACVAIPFHTTQHAKNPPFDLPLRSLEKGENKTPFNESVPGGMRRGKEVHLC